MHILINHRALAAWQVYVYTHTQTANQPARQTVPDQIFFFLHTDKTIYHPLQKGQHSQRFILACQDNAE